MARYITVTIIFTALIVLVASDNISNKHIVKSSSDSVRKPKDCSDLDPKHDPSGVYRIYPTADRVFKVYCDMKTDGGRWTVLIRRMDGSQDFNKKWIEYENGFGNLNREFWLGNQYLHILTPVKNTEMRVDMENFKGDALAPTHNGMKFTTPDQDNDNYKANCALIINRVGGGWWFNACDTVCFTLSYANNKKGLTGENLINGVVGRVPNIL
ncbi:Ficolin-1 [Mytilus edulis]|uniref:Ficolin-1 n=1 Tax=Mytilus edulis TaxID=6550 RepID=A0A8S3TYS4_MYTED|nr:Ficolin-1 [Mytilus edulis]